MKKLLCITALLAMTFATVSMVSAKTYVNGIDANYPPFAYIDEKTGQPSGFDVDSMNWIANKMGFTVTHKPVAWDGIIPSLLAKQIDMVCSGMSISEKRKQMAEFSNPYWSVVRVFVVPNTSSLTPADILSKKVKLGVQRGTSEADAIQQEQKAKGYAFELRMYDSAPLIIKDMLDGRIDAAFMDALPAEDSINKGRPVKKVGVHGTPDEFGVALRKGDKELRTLVDDGYKLLMADPYWQELQKKYLNK